MTVKKHQRVAQYLTTKRMIVAAVFDPKLWFQADAALLQEYFDCAVISPHFVMIAGKEHECGFCGRTRQICQMRKGTRLLVDRQVKGLAEGARVPSVPALPPTDARAMGPGNAVGVKQPGAQHGDCAKVIMIFDGRTQGTVSTLRRAGDCAAVTSWDAGKATINLGMQIGGDRGFIIN